MASINQPEKHSNMSPHPPAPTKSQSTRMVNAYGEKAAGEAGKKTVEYVATEDNVDEAKAKAQEQMDKAKAWWAKTFPCFASAV